MNEKLMIILGVWVFADAIFSLYTYLGKEGIKENSIRVVRLAVGITMVWMAI